MNQQAVFYTDEVVSVLLDKYNLPNSIPVVSSGGSMGGLSALVYERYANHTPIACVDNCPVCDLVYHYTERLDLPRTLYSSFYYSNTEKIEDALKTASPLHLADEMPKIHYYIFHCENDEAVVKEKHSDKFVDKMQTTHNIKYHTVPGRGHCHLTDEMLKLYKEYIINAILTYHTK